MNVHERYVPGQTDTVPALPPPEARGVLPPPPRSRWRNVVGLVLVAIAAAAAAWTGWHVLAGGKAENAGASAQQAIPVTLGTAKSEDVPIFVTGLGTVQAYLNVAVKSRVDGQIDTVSFTEGQDVKAGDPLFQIDPRPYQAAVEQAQANKQKDDAQLQAAQLVLQRYAKLVASSFQTQEAYDNQKATVGQLEASAAADQALIDAAQLNLQYAQIRSPIDGRTGARLVDPGNTVQASQGTTLVTIAQIKPIFVSFTVPQEWIDQIRQNQAEQPLDVIAYSSDDQTMLSLGKLSLIDNQIDVTTGTIHLKATFANEDERLWPGEFVNARLVIGKRKDIVTVPAETVMQGPAGPYVYVVRPDDTVERLDIAVAATQDGVAAISQGLKSGERVVVSGQFRLTSGAKIAAAEPPQPARAASQAANNVAAAPGAGQTGGGGSAPPSPPPPQAGTEAPAAAPGRIPAAAPPAGAASAAPAGAPQ